MLSKKAHLKVATCLFALLAAPPAVAQVSAPAPAAADTGETGVTDIIVTAQRRSESLQKTSLTIEVLNSKQLSSAGVTSATQLSSVLPSVQVGTSGPATSVFVRGVGGFAANASSNPAVPYFIDGVYVPRTQEVTAELYDIDRIEVIKGPQGTLYGRNASGGAINVLTVRPVLGRVEGHVDAEFGNYGNQNGEAAINLPLGDHAAIRASGTVVDKDGFTSVGFGDDKHAAGRVKLLWQPSQDISLLLNTSYGEIYGRHGSVVTLNRDIPGWYPWLDVSDPRAQAYAASTAVVPVPGFVRSTNPGDAKQDLRFFNVSGQLDWNLGDTTLTIIPGYRYSQQTYNALLGFLVVQGAQIGSIPATPNTSKQTSLETRLAGEKGPLKYVLGLYYDNEDQQEQFSINGGFLQSVAQKATLGTRSFATFGQGTFAASDSIRMILGARYTWDRRTFEGNAYVISPVAFLGAPPPQAANCALPPPGSMGGPTQPQCVVDTFAGNKTFKNFSWKVGLEADVLNGGLLYATASRGFKAGAFNGQSALGQPGVALMVEPEVLTAYEIGLKTRLLENKLQLNLSGFYWDYGNHQEPVLTYTNVPGITNLVFLNAGKSEIYGATADFVARPWTGGTISGSVEYAHSTYKSFTKTIPTFSYNPMKNGCRVAAQDPGNTTLDCSGFQVSRTPEWSGGIGISQEFAVGTGKLIARSDFSFASSRWVGTDFVPVLRVKQYGKVDAALTYQGPSARWSVTGFVRNITNAAIYTDGAETPFSRLTYVDIQPPRTYGVRFGVKF